MMTAIMKVTYGQVGYSDLYDTKLVSSLEQPITHIAEDGTVTVTVSNPVGGIWIASNKLQLLAPYIDLAFAISIATVVTGVLVKRRNEKQ